MSPVSNALSAYNTLLAIGDGGGPEVFTNIAEVFGITGPGLSADILDVTHMESPGRFREKIVGLLDAGEVSFEINWIPDNATHAKFITDFKARTKRNFEVTWPDTASTLWSFAAFFSGEEPSAVPEDKLTTSITLTITGEPTLV